MGSRPRAWDGTGHYAVAQIYSAGIFPDTFGWTDAYFGGMPVPNFYPPLFYWLVAALAHTGAFSFTGAFKFVLVLPVVALPAGVWLLGWVASGRNTAIATASGLAVAPLLLDYRFYRPIGLDYLSTFGIGLYTQPLGFVLLLLWLCVHLGGDRARRWQLSGVLLALTVLANFFNAATAAVFVAARAVSAWRLAEGPGSTHASGRGSLVEALTPPVVALGLCAFWLAPMMGTYDYFVTRPFTVPLQEMIPPAMWGWYAVSIYGAWRWWRTPTGATSTYLGACAALALVIAFAAVVAPPWFPLQATRFATTLNFLLAVPVGYAATAAVTGLRLRLASILAVTDRERTGDRLLVGILVAVLGAGLVLLTPSFYTRAFYKTADREVIDTVLGFARGHADGRYLVENAPHAHAEAALDGRALSAFLGAQGNEVASVVFREASPGALFFNPLTNAFSAEPDNFGMSSILADDLDFQEQSLALHLDRARWVGVKYLVIVSPEIKERISRDSSVTRRFDLGSWTVFQIRDDAVPRAVVLPFRPALVVSDLSFKQRTRHGYGFTRFAEEQFADDWFDVVMARSAEGRLDRLVGLERFAALVVDEYACDDRNAAVEAIRAFAADRTVVLLASESPLFEHLRRALDANPRVYVLDRPHLPPGDAVEAETPSYRYDGSPERDVWRRVRDVLEQTKVPTDVAATVGGWRDGPFLFVQPDGQAVGEEVPILIGMTYYPRWTRTDGAPVYAATPFFTLTFASGPVTLAYARNGRDVVGLIISGATALGLAGWIFWRIGRRIRKGEG